jgi:hypothetical protein
MPDRKALPGDETGEGWIEGAGGVAYPPAPWRLGGSMAVSLWSFPRRNLPQDILQEGLAPRGWFGRSILATAFAVYEPGGVLAYNELLLALRVRASGRGMVNVPAIWVDSSASVAGARALWAVPKELASFTAGQTMLADGGRIECSFEARNGDCLLASMRFRSRAALPGWWRTRSSIVQASGGDRVITRAQALSRIAIGSAIWEFPVESPLGFLRGRRPLVSLRLHRMTMAFGI